MIRERCSCGAEFETDEQHPIRLLKEWRNNHRHAEPQPTQRDSSATSSTEIVTADKPEMLIGFRSDPFEE